MKVISVVLSVAVLGLVFVLFDMQASNSELKLALEKARGQQANFEDRLASQRHAYENKLAKLERDLLLESRARKKFESSKKPQLSLPGESDVDNSGAVVLEALRKDQISRSIDEKYALLLSAVEVSPSDAEKLHDMLVQRQKILNSPLATYYTKPEDIEIAVEQQQLFLQELDKHVSNILSDDNYQIYDMVKESDFEQYQLKQFESLLVEDEKLTREQENELLLSKLKNKQIYNQSLSEANSLLESGEVEKASELMSRAVNEYRDNYFMQASQFVSESQFIKLREYEREHFKQMLESLLAAYQTQSN